jgi:Uma2 family endonuclease
MSVASNATSALANLRLPKGFKPAWEVVGLLPGQGDWTEGEYLWLTDKLDSDRRVELVDGRIEVLPVPTQVHQLINGFLYRVLFAFVEARALGIVVFTGLRVEVRDTNFRQTDVVYMSRENPKQCSNKFWEGADLAMEVVSEDDPDRDYVEKRKEYAKAGIGEYWIADPRDRSVTLLVLKDKRYQKRGTYRDGDTVPSVILPGFSLAVSEIFDAAKLAWDR